jgi:hypothetical protein
MMRNKIKDTPNFYKDIEFGIRDVVKLLRDNGINTTCSCGHEMYVEFECCSSTMVENIYNVLFNAGYRGFRINYALQCPPDGFVIRRGTILLNKWME